MKLWRTKKMSQEAGRLTQVCVWAPESEAERVREICTRVAEPTARGEYLRLEMRSQLARRRTTWREWHGFTSHVEIDYPFIGPWWFMKNIGGRILGLHGTHIELSPDEADTLMERLSRSCQREIEAWLKEQNLVDAVRDPAGVVTGREAPEDSHRPADETAFAENEARIARVHTEAARASRQPPVDDPSVIPYEGTHGFPSFCQIAHRRQGDRVQFALIHMPNGGTSPTNMFESLATHLRQRFYPKVDAGKIDWFDVVPPDLYQWMPFTITAVTLQHANGVYSDPVWRLAKDDEDWRTLILDTIARGQPARHIAQAAPHPDAAPETGPHQPQAAGHPKRR